MISIDRPGYGNSNFGSPLTDIEKQAHIIAKLINGIQSSFKPILIGHSYGGTFAARLAMDFPDLMVGIILVGAAVDPENEKIFWFSSLEKVRPIKWMVPASLKVANAEKLSHISELKKMKPFWAKIKTNVTILHGEKDGLVPVENAYYADKMITSNWKKLVIKKSIGHLIPWTNPEMIKTEINEMAEKIN
jgi:pimeloyl-ACP methyl ester carboxylesterase